MVKHKRAPSKELCVPATAHPGRHRGLAGLANRLCSKGDLKALALTKAEQHRMATNHRKRMDKRTRYNLHHSYYSPYHINKNHHRKHSVRTRYRYTRRSGLPTLRPHSEPLLHISIRTSCLSVDGVLLGGGVDSSFTCQRGA